MKTWMAGTLTICGAAFLLATAWGVVGLLDSADKVVDQGRLMMASLRGTTMQVHRMAQDAVQNQKTLVEAIDRLSRASAAAMDRLSTAGVAAINGAVARLDRLADTLEAAACQAVAGADQVLTETAATVRAVRADLISAGVAALEEATGTLASARGVADQAREELASTGAEVRQAVAGVRPVLENTAELTGTVNEVAKQGVTAGEEINRVLAYYAKLITHPTKGQVIKGWAKLILSSLPAIGNLLSMF